LSVETIYSTSKILFLVGPTNLEEGNRKQIVNYDCSVSSIPYPSMPSCIEGIQKVNLHWKVSLENQNLHDEHTFNTIIL